MLISRNITFDELKALHQETADRVECVECYEARTPWFDDQRIAEGYWMAISDDVTLNLMEIAVLKESEASLVERINEQHRYTEQSVKEVDRLYERISELESHVQDSAPRKYLKYLRRKNR